MHARAYLGLRSERVQDVLLIPEIETNLLSVSKAKQNGCEIIFRKDRCMFKLNGEICLEARKVNNLYEVQLAFENYANVVQSCNNKNCLELWHRRLGYGNLTSIKEVTQKQLARGIQINNCKHNIDCEPRIKAKLTDEPDSKIAEYRATKRLQLIHSDVCGSFQTPTIGGK